MTPNRMQAANAVQAYKPRKIEMHTSNCFCDVCKRPLRTVNLWSWFEFLCCSKPCALKAIEEDKKLSPSRLEMMGIQTKGTQCANTSNHKSSMAKAQHSFADVKNAGDSSGQINLFDLISTASPSEQTPDARSTVERP